MSTETEDFNPDELRALRAVHYHAQALLQYRVWQHEFASAMDSLRQALSEAEYANPSLRKQELPISQLITDNETLRRDVSQLAARLQSLRNHLRDKDWRVFVFDHPLAKNWFDADGVPILPSAKRLDDEH